MGLVKLETGKGEKLAEQLYSVKEAAEYLRISAQSLYNKISQGRIDYSKVGGRVIFKRSTLEKLVEQGVVKALREYGNN